MKQTEALMKERYQLTGSTGGVIWLTGLSGAGKSTLSHHLEARLIHQGILACCLDGDEIRAKITNHLGFSMADRIAQNQKMAHLAALTSDWGLLTIVTIISPLAQMRDDARSLIGTARFAEVYVKAGVTVCQERDPKGLYQRHEQGQIPMMTGITSEYQEPEYPDVVVDTEHNDLNQCLNQLEQFVLKKYQLINK